MDSDTTSLRVVVSEAEQYVSTSDLIGWLRANAVHALQRPVQAPAAVFDLLADELTCFEYEPIEPAGPRSA